jgi:hypothetical protein
MPDIDDLHLHRPPVANDSGIDKSTDVVAPHSVEQPDQATWIVLIALFLIAAALTSYAVLWRRTAVPLSPAATVTTPPAPAVAPKPAGPLVEAEKIPLPPLSETDALVRQLVVKLTSHPKALAWLATNGLIENFTVATLNVSEGKTPVVHLRTLAPQARFSVLKTDRGFIVDPKSFHRYDEYAAAVSGLDPANTARLYLTLKPRITDAYRALGFPEGDFDTVLESAFKNLLSTPAIAGDVALREKVLSYQFVDPEIESLTTAQKQLLRMGPDNMRRVQDQLREIARQLGLHP